MLVHNEDLANQSELKIQSSPTRKGAIVKSFLHRISDIKRKCLIEIGTSDEMNLHLPQSVNATQEVASLMKVSSRLISGQNNSPVSGIVQDGLIAAYLLTNTWSCSKESMKFSIDKTGMGLPHTMVKKSVFMNCITSSNISLHRYKDLLRRAKKYYPDYIFNDSNSLQLEDEIPGKLAFSIVFPSNLCYTKKTDTSLEFPTVKIEEGVILPDSGPICKKIIGAKGGSIVHVLCIEYSPETAVQLLTDIQFLTDYWLPHHGFSIGISDCQTKGHKKVVNSLAAMRSELQTLNSEEEDPEELEAKINSYLGKMGNVGVDIAVKSMSKDDRNAWNIMRKSGAKGNIANLGATVAFVGQQYIAGCRIPTTLSGGRRSLPCFEVNDNSPEARGFVSGNYLHGISPDETFFHAETGREGVIATAIRTGDTGYIHKKISRKMEDLKVHWDGTVRNANGKIIEFLYGDDGLDPQKLYHCSNVSFPFFANTKSISLILNKDAERTKEVSSKEEKPRKLKEEEIEILLSYIKIGSPGMQSDITLNATKSIHNALRTNLSNTKLYECKIWEFCRKVLDQFETSKSQNGEMVGLIAASSIGEPTTQMSVHHDEKVTIIKWRKDRSTFERIDTKIGEFCNDRIFNSSDYTIFLNDSSETSLEYLDDDYYIESVTPDETVTWSKISHISRHPVNGNLIKVVTKSGREVTTTLSHSHLKRNIQTSKIEPVKGSDLKVGNRIPVWLGCKDLDEEEDKIEGVKELLIFLFKNMYKSEIQLLRMKDLIPFEENIPDLIKRSDLKEYIKQIRRDIKSCSIEEKNVPKFMETFKLLKQAAKSNVFWDEIVDINEFTPNDGYKYVYDFTVPGTETFMLSNGVFVHNTLNVFHSSGNKGKDVSLGVPRFQELLNATEDPKKPSCSIYFDDQYLKDMAESSLTLENQIADMKSKLTPKEMKILAKAGKGEKVSSKKIKRVQTKENMLQQLKIESLRYVQKLSEDFEEIKIERFIESWEMMYIPLDVNPEIGASPVNIIKYNEYKDTWWSELFQKLNKDKFDSFNPQCWVLRLYLNIEKLFSKGVKLKKIAKAIEKNTEGCALCICSPTNLGIIDISTNFSQIRKFLKSKRPKASRVIDSELPLRITEDNLEFFLCRDELIPYIYSIKMAGISKITKVYPTETTKKEWMLDTKGTNLSEILTIPGIDEVRTATDDIWSIYRIFGIEATRKFLIEEMTRVISFDGTYVNPRHIQLLVDSMTDSGEITNVNRNGISRDEGQLKKIMFEQPVDNAVEAAAFSEIDRLTSIPATVMYGMTAQSGTGVVDIQSTDQIPVKLPKLPKINKKK